MKPLLKFAIKAFYSFGAHEKTSKVSYSIWKLNNSIPISVPGKARPFNEIEADSAEQIQKSEK